MSCMNFEIGGDDFGWCSNYKFKNGGTTNFCNCKNCDNYEEDNSKELLENIRKHCLAEMEDKISKLNGSEEDLQFHRLWYSTLVEGYSIIYNLTM